MHCDELARIRESTSEPGEWMDAGCRHAGMPAMGRQARQAIHVDGGHRAARAERERKRLDVRNHEMNE
jgi:hypothetical protein